MVKLYYKYQLGTIGAGFFGIINLADSDKSAYLHGNEIAEELYHSQQYFMNIQPQLCY